MIKEITIALVMVSTCGCSTIGHVVDSMNQCDTRNYSGTTPQERAAQLPRYCGSTGSTYLVTTSGPYLYTSTVVNVQNLNKMSGMKKTMTDEQIHNLVYGRFKTDKYGKILNWNEVK